MKKVIEELKERKKHLEKWYEIFVIMALAGLVFFVPYYFEPHIIFSLSFVVLVGFGAIGSFVTLLQLSEIDNTIILIERTKGEKRS